MATTIAAAADRLGVRGTSAMDPRGLLTFGATGQALWVYPLIVFPALLAGFLATPIFFIWLGVSLWRGARA